MVREGDSDVRDLCQFDSPESAAAATASNAIRHSDRLVHAVFDIVYGRPSNPIGACTWY